MREVSSLPHADGWLMERVLCFVIDSGRVLKYTFCRGYSALEFGLG